MIEEKNLTLEKAFSLALKNQQKNLETAENLCKDILKKESNHFKANKNDKHSTGGLLKAVNQRKRLLEYLKTKNLESYKKILTKLNLRK